MKAESSSDRYESGPTDGTPGETVTNPRPSGGVGTGPALPDPDVVEGGLGRIQIVLASRAGRFLGDDDQLCVLFQTISLLGREVDLEMNLAGLDGQHPRGGVRDQPHADRIQEGRPLV